MPTTVRTSTDLYAVLGVDASVGGDEIARAFRMRAKELHPDTNADPEAARQFNDLVAAYGVLSNHRTRREYDQARTPAISVASPPVRNGASTPAPVAATKGWSLRKAWTALIVGALVAVLGVGAAFLTWQLHQHDAQRHARFDPGTAVRVGNGGIVFVTADGRTVRTREPELHGEGNGLGPTVKIRYDPADPTHVIVDANTIGRDITFAIVALKLIVGGLVFVVLGARRVRKLSAQTRATATTGAR